MESESCSCLQHKSLCHYCAYYLLKLDLICGLDLWELLFLALLCNYAYNCAKSPACFNRMIICESRREERESATSAWLCKYGTLYPQSICKCKGIGVGGGFIEHFRNYFVSKTQKSCGIKIFISILMFNKLPAVSWDVVNPVWMLLAHGKCQAIRHSFPCRERWLN